MATNRNIARYRSANEKNSAKALEKKLEQEFRAMAIETEHELAEVVQRAEARMRATAPVDSGALRRSIDVAAGRDGRGFYVDLSVGPFYSSFVEYGTVHIPPRPFFRPAVAQAIAQFQKGTH